MRSQRRQRHWYQKGRVAEAAERRDQKRKKQKKRG
jgi:hypothetical protein